MTMGERWRWLVVICGAALTIGGCAGGGGGSSAASGDDGGPTSLGPGAGGIDGGSGDTPSSPPQAGGSPDGGVDGGTDGGTAGGVPLGPPLSQDGWTFYAAAQGLSGTVEDVSTDEAGNVYVAGGDALYVKKRPDQQFLRFDSDNAGITKSCYANVDLANLADPTPPGPPAQCPIISVAGGVPGRALIGFQGHGTDGDSDADWATNSGCADEIAFDGTAVTRTRHVYIASPPHRVCGSFENGSTVTCSPTDRFWLKGRQKLRQVFRIAVNHEVGSPMYGDAWMGGTHSTLTALFNEQALSRGWVDITSGWPGFEDARNVWEHAHPAFVNPFNGRFLTGYTYALTIDPTTGLPWASNGFRLTTTSTYGADLSAAPFETDIPMLKAWDLVPDVLDGTVDPEQPPWNDGVMSLSFCGDGALWVGSGYHGLGRFDTAAGTITWVGAPDASGSVWSVACDPSDGSIWVGSGFGGVYRYQGGAFSRWPAGLPAAANELIQHVPMDIQIDRWTTPRIVYFAMLPNAAGAPGGVIAYDGL
jgi:hypothetical protein